jgi:hypothetical protein
MLLILGVGPVLSAAVVFVPSAFRRRIKPEPDASHRHAELSLEVLAEAEESASPMDANFA